MAGSYTVPEVAVFFNNKLYRGNRTTKVSTGSLQAFDSPNMSPLATAGISIHGKCLSGDIQLEGQDAVISIYLFTYPSA